MARGYQWLLRKALRHRFATVCIALIVLGLSVYGTTFMQGEFFPASDRPELLVSLTLPANASQSEAQNRVEKLEKATAGNRNVERFRHTLGRERSVFTCLWMCFWQMKISPRWWWWLKILKRGIVFIDS